MSENADFDDVTRGHVQDLLSINIDSSKGWQHAADDVKDPSLRKFFAEMSAARQSNAQELRDLVESFGEKPSERGSVSGQLHRWWVDAKAALTGGDAHSVLAEAERGEDSIKHEYEEALREIDDRSVRSVVERQFRNVQQGHNQVKAMRDRYRNPPG